MGNISSRSQTIARPANSGGTSVDSTCPGTRSANWSNHHRLSAVRMRPLSGIRLGSTQSNAEIRSDATTSNEPSAKSYRSRTFPL